MPMPPPSSETKRVATPKDGAVRVTTQVIATERELAEERDNIVLSLHAAYLNLVDHMAEFQRQWDADPVAAFLLCSIEGGHAGGAEWLKDQASLFEPALWSDLGGKIKGAAGAAYDRLDTYRAKRFAEIRDAVNKVGDPEDTLLNWAWWEKNLESKIGELAGQHAQLMKDAEKAAKESVASVLAGAKMADAIYRNRAAIINLPTLIAEGKPKPIQAFVDTVLFEIDPELARAIKRDPNFAYVLEVIADHDSALTYLSYVGLMLEAIPPNFYAYQAGKGGAYLMIEVVLLIVSALLSAGAAVAARVGMLVARFASAGVKVVSANRRIKHARAALDAFIRIIEDLAQAAQDLRHYGAKLVQARSNGLVINGSTRTTITAKKASIRRDRKCKICGSTAHGTPRGRLGVVEYE